MRKRSAALIVTLLLMGSLFGTVGTAAGISTGVISGWVYDASALPSCGGIFPADHTILVDAFDTNMNRTGPVFVTGVGWYEFSALEAGDYKVRFKRGYYAVRNRPRPLDQPPAAPEPETTDQETPAEVQRDPEAETPELETPAESSDSDAAAAAPPAAG